MNEGKLYKGKLKMLMSMQCLVPRPGNQRSRRFIYPPEGRGKGGGVMVYLGERVPNV